MNSHNAFLLPTELDCPTVLEFGVKQHQILLHLPCCDFAVDVILQEFGSEMLIPNLIWLKGVLGAVEGLSQREDEVN